MDNVTHTLFALTLARTPLGRGRGTTAALVLASNAPDVDVVATLGGAAEYLRWHRGPTHGPLGVIGLGLVTAGLVWGARRLIERRANGRAPRMTVAGQRAGSGGNDADAVAPFATLLFASVAGVVAHILMDLPTSYGTRMLSPFSWRWFAMDLMPIIDVYLWAILAGGLVVGSRGAPGFRGARDSRDFTRSRGSRWRGMRRHAAVGALALMAANYGVRAAAHQEALSIASRLYGSTLPAPCDGSAAFGSLFDSWPPPGELRIHPDHCLMDTSAVPDFLSPFEWRIIARQPDAYDVYRINVLDARLRNADASAAFPSDDAAHVPNPWSALIARAAATRSAQVLLGFSRSPVASVLVEPSGAATVQFTDLRFTGLENPRPQARRSALFTVTVTFGPRNELLEERLGQ